MATDFSGWTNQREHDRERRRQYKNPNRATLFDLLFEEVDNTPEIEEPVKRRLKQNVRRSFGQRSGAAPATREPSTGPPPTAADDLVKVVVPARDCADTERLIRGAAGSDEYGADEYVVEARRIADQLRHCLSQHTETAQKVSAYLRALLVLSHGHYRPKMVIEI
jgi:hypothetical protein